MGWPISQDSFDDVDDLFYDFTPEELGIDVKNAAKIQEIRRLRPLSTHQPWGIYFVKFEPKRLPVVALRRILSQVVLKNRASANSTERVAWSANDLLFVSNYGDGDERRISFAHFAQSEVKKDLPTLKVLGWDNLDTPLHLDRVAELLTERLSWPDDEEDETEWRRQWRSAFTLVHREVITTSKKLSIELAALARSIRDRINTVLAIETKNGPVSSLMGAFKEALVHDLDEDGFADMYAQTIAYGLLSARVANPTGGTADDVAAAMPVTNPFLKELLETFLDVGGRKGKAGKGLGLDFDELGVGDVVELLDAANMEAVLRDFGDKNPQEDPVIHFYELFLREYDAKKRMQRGVFYTPRPVVSFIVRSVDELLRTEFGLKEGLADVTTWGEMADRFDSLEIPLGATSDQAFVQILDPATGTGTFLVEVIGLIHKTMTEKWQAEGHDKTKIESLWNDYVPEHLLSRLHGYELMMAPYAIAHMKIGLKLFETGYRFGSEERARVYLTNALEPAQDFSETLAFAIPALAREAEAVNAIKRNQRFTVVIGNPPYSASLTEPRWLMEKLADWKRDLEEKKMDLNREEWKFLRLGEHLCELSGAGIVGHVINRDFLDGITKRRMREHLQRCFPVRLIHDLNGDVKGNVSDENVFEIQQGVCVALLCKSISDPRQHFASMVGRKEAKYDLLMASVASSAQETPTPVGPFFSWVPSEPKEGSGSYQIYESWRSINSVFPVYSSGIQTKRDRLTIHYTEDELWNTVEEFNGIPAEEARGRFGLGDDGRDWSVAWAKADVAHSGPSRDFITRILYRPFDTRFTYWTGRTKGFLAYPRRAVMRHVVGHDNIGILFNRQVVGREVSHFGVSRIPVCHGTFYLGNKGQDYYAPLYLFEERLLGSDRPPANLNPAFLNGSGLSPNEVLSYVYAICWSPTYRSRYGQFLKRDFARIPESTSPALIGRLASIGEELIGLHLMESSVLDEHNTTLVGSGDFHVEKISYSDDTVWIDKAKTRGFGVVPKQVWNFHVGGYQVCNKWLKDRQAKGGKNPHLGRVLTDEDIDHYQRMVVALNETIRIMAEIDNVIEQHGGWPRAFEASTQAADESNSREVSERGPELGQEPTQ